MRLAGAAAVIAVHWEGARCRAVVKPAGVPVFPPHEDPGGACVLAALLAAHPEQAQGWPAGFEGGIAHRLDTPTSGLLLVARAPADLAWLRGLFAEKQLRKRYLFLTARRVPWREHVISADLAHDPRRKSRMIVRRGQDTPHRGRWLPAETRLSYRGPLGELSCWQAEMRTGVMHQIRAHAAFAGLALAGDRLYGGGESPPRFPAAFALHHAAIAGPGIAVPALEPPAWWRA